LAKKKVKDRPKQRGFYPSPDVDAWLETQPTGAVSNIINQAIREVWIAANSPGTVKRVEAIQKELAAMCEISP
jgi:hypothetical protein